MIMEKSCQNCPYVSSKDTEIAQLKREVEFLYLMIDLGMTAVEAWAKQNGLLSPTKEVLKQCRSQGGNQIGVLLERIGKSGQPATLDGLIQLLKLL